MIRWISADSPRGRYEARSFNLFCEKDGRDIGGPYTVARTAKTAIASAKRQAKRRNLDRVVVKSMIEPYSVVADLQKGRDF